MTRSAGRSQEEDAAAFVGPSDPDVMELRTVAKCDHTGGVDLVVSPLGAGGHAVPSRIGVAL